MVLAQTKRCSREAYINIIRDMYAGCKTSVSAGKTKGIEIEVGLHQGSALSPLLFVIIIDVIRAGVNSIFAIQFQFR